MTSSAPRLHAQESGAQGRGDGVLESALLFGFLLQVGWLVPGDAAGNDSHSPWKGTMEGRLGHSQEGGNPLQEALVGRAGDLLETTSFDTAPVTYWWSVSNRRRQELQASPGLRPPSCTHCVCHTRWSKQVTRPTRMREVRVALPVHKRSSRTLRPCLPSPRAGLIPTAA